MDEIGWVTAYVLTEQGQMNGALFNKEFNYEGKMAEAFIGSIMETFPTSPIVIAKQQALDTELQLSPHVYGVCLVEGCTILMDNGKIVIPKMLQIQIVEWYHTPR